MVDCKNCRYRFILANAFDIHSDLCKEMNKPEWIERTKEQMKKDLLNRSSNNKEE